MRASKSVCERERERERDRDYARENGTGVIARESFGVLIYV